MTQEFLRQLEIAQARAESLVEAIDQLKRIVTTNDEQDELDMLDLDDREERYWR